MTNEEFFEQFGYFASAPDGILRLRGLILDLAISGRISTGIDGQSNSNEAGIPAGNGTTGSQSEGTSVNSSLPEGWKHEQLGQLATVQSGFAFRSSDWAEDGVPVVKIKNVGDGGLDMTNCSFVSPEVAAQAPKAALKVGDILITMTGHVGEVAVVDREGLVLNQRVGRFTIERPDLLSADFLVNLLIAPQTQRFLSTEAQGTAQANISPKSIQSVVVPIPPYAAQEKIVARVNELLSLCEELEAEQEKGKDLRAATVHSSLSALVDSDRSDGDQSLEFIERHLKLLLRPGEGALDSLEHIQRAGIKWLAQGSLNRDLEGQMCALGDISIIRGGQQPKRDADEHWGGGLPFLMGGDFSDSTYRISSGSRTLSEQGVQASGSPLIDSGSIVMMTVGATIGKVCLLDSPMHISPNLTGISPKGDHLESDFLYWQLVALRDELESIGGGSAQPFISKKNLGKIEILVPTKPDQRLIVSRIVQLMKICEDLRGKLTRERDLARGFADSSCHLLLHEPKLDQAPSSA